MVLDPIKHVLPVFWTASKTFLEKRVSREFITMILLWTYTNKEEVLSGFQNHCTWCFMDHLIGRWGYELSMSFWNFIHTLFMYFLRTEKYLSRSFGTLENKFNCLVYEMLLIRELPPSLNVQLDSIQAKLFAWHYIFRYYVNFGQLFLTLTLLQLLRNW